MFEKLSNSWELAKMSWNVLKADKELIVFPIASFFASLIVVITFMVPMIVTGALESATDSGAIGIVGMILMFLFYSVLYFVTIFSNSALVGAALIRLRGGDPTVKDGFGIAMKHIGPIAGYAVIAATVGMVLRAVSERSGAIGRIVISLIGMAWGLATFLVVPVLVNEEVGPVEAIKRSGNLLKKTWGEQIAGNFTIGTVFGLIIFALIVVGILMTILVAGTGSGALIGTVVLFFVLAVLGVGLISSTLSGIYAAAVYNYATEGDAGSYFDPEIIKNTFKSKPAKSGLFG